MQTRLRYNDAVKTTSEQQFLLNIVRLRYTDTPSSLSISSIADQQELVAGLQAIPFFASAGAGDIGSYRGSVWPQAELSRTSRPTLSYTPLDDEEFTRRLFTPVSLEGAIYLSKTTWPISTVFRLYLENLNWVSNAETASGPTPADPPVYAEFLEGVLELQQLQDKQLITLFNEDREVVVAGPFVSEKDIVTDAIDAARNDLELKRTESGYVLVRHEEQPVLKASEEASSDLAWSVFCHAFHLDPTESSFDNTTEKLAPYTRLESGDGLNALDLETRSLLQVLFFVSHGVDVPEAHRRAGIAPQTCGYDGGVFDWQEVLGGLFRVHSCAAKKPPESAYVAVKYRDHWYYIDQRDRESKATFALLLEVSRLELQSTEAKSPLLTLPLGR